MLVFLANIFALVLRVAALIAKTPHPLRTSAPSPLGEGWKSNRPLPGERVAAMRRRVRGHFAGQQPLGCGTAALRYIFSCVLTHAGFPTPTRKPQS